MPCEFDSRSFRVFYINCSRCGPQMATSDYMEDGVCGPCLLTEITEELGLYERGEFVDEEQVGTDGKSADG